jgi:hypothetical protein
MRKQSIMRKFIYTFTQNNPAQITLLPIVLALGLLSILANNMTESQISSSRLKPWTTSLSPDTLKAMSLGYPNSIASVKWMEAIASYSALVQQKDFQAIANQLDVITSLNPLAAPPYFLSATLPWESGSTEASNRLLSRAMHAMPEIWNWPYYKGFNAYWFDHDFVEAGKLLAHAAKLPHAPPVIASLALRMKAEAGQLDTGLVFLENMIKEQQDKDIRESLLKQRRIILTEKELRALDHALAKLPAQYHDRRDLIALQKSGYPVPSKLADGGHIVFNSNGEIVSSVSRNRFKVYVPPKRQNKNVGTPVK